MKYVIYLIFFTFLIFADADIKDNYKNDLGYNIFLLNNNFLNSGKYSFKNSKIAKNHSFVFEYLFENNSSLKPLFIGGVGFSEFNSQNADIDSRFLKVGGSFRYVVDKNLILDMGAQNLWLDSDMYGLYKKNFSNNTKNTMNDLFFRIKDCNNYDDTIILSEIALHYQIINYDFNLNKTRGISGDIEVAMIKKNITQINSLPISLKGYLGSSILDKNLANITGFNYTATFGGNIFINIGKYSPIYKEKLKDLNLNFSAQVTKGDNDFSGYKFGVGVKLLNF